LANHDKYVLEHININKYVSTIELCDTFNISESTARRLLLRLSDRGLIHRCRGGAMSVVYSNVKNGIQVRYECNADVKDRIARAAAARVTPGSTIMLMGGTTIFKMCKYIIGMKLTVITNSLIILDALKDANYIDILMLGGKFDRSEMEIVGAIANSNLKLLRADSLFMSATNFHPRIGFLTDVIDSIELYERCIEAVSERFILADSSKLGTSGAAVTATCEQLDCLITDSALDEYAVTEFREKGLEVVLV